jgi:hypothetical protein
MISRGPGLLQAMLDGVVFNVYTYKPNGPVRGILLIYHGTSRTAGTYRDYAINLADLNDLVVAAPLFDKARFRIRDYHRGGLVDRSGRLKPASQWTTRFVALLADWVRRQEGAAMLPYWCWGHSAGAQFLSRVAAFEQPDARRIVLANASSYVLPLVGSYPKGEAAPYGMGGVYAAAEEQAKLRGYLGMPVTIYLGSRDNDPGDPDLSMKPEAQRQGAQRRHRGERTFILGRRQATALSCAFSWQLVYAPEGEHNTAQMMRSRRVLKAMNFSDMPEDRGRLAQDADRSA